MAVYTVPIPSLLNGVSTQAAQLRLPSQGEEMINAYPTLQNGLGKWPPTLFVKSLGHESSFTNNTANAKVHIINRDAVEQYAVIVTNGGVRVFDLAGNEKTVNTPDGVGYLNTFPGENIQMMTVADYTFIVNRNKTVQMAATKSPARPKEALVHVLAGNYGRSYKVRINGNRASEYRTPDGGHHRHEPYVDPIVITRVLLHGLQTSIGTNELLNNQTPTDGGTADYVPGDNSTQPFDNGTGDMYHWGSGGYDSGDWSTTRYGTALHIKNVAGNDFTISVDDGFNGNAMKAMKSSTQRFTNLPIEAPDGYVVEVTGESSNGFDNYWVRYNESKKVWEEAVEPDTPISLDASTMPHILVRESDGTFTFRQATWADKEVGDVNSNPPPGFVGQKIRDITFHRNRLCLVAGENVTLSRAGEYFNFWRETVTTILDTDPIDVGISTKDVATINYAIPMSEDLLLFSEQSQLRLTSGSELMTPRTAAIHAMSRYRSKPDTMPLAMADKVYFNADMGDNSVVRELWLEHDIKEHRQLELTSHCPDYVPNHIWTLMGSAAASLLFGLKWEERDALYVYKYYWTQNDDKPQSAWGKWTFSGFTILGGDVVSNTLVLLGIYNENVHMVFMPLEIGYADEGLDFAHLLDQRTNSGELAAGTYDDIADTTTFTLPYAADGVEAWWEGHRLIVDSTSGNTITVEGDQTGKTIYFGLPYEFLWRFSPIYLRSGRGNNGAEQVVVDGRTQVQKMRLLYGETAGFVVEVTPEARGTYTYEVIDAPVDDPDYILDEVVPDDGVYSFPVRAENTKVTIEIKSDLAIPCWFTAAEAQVLYQPRFKKA